ncbi:hypothetical protein C1H46_013660 [Malus baccata]|uniref:RING-type domain-containing protein n=1 Tax=Malus baccata TaxID=106549 RepID=A0A540MPJ9_MALBA|nr:hypothetical protein C1H46_013660 [Malus baccata]
MSNSKRTQYIVSDAWQTSEPFEEDPDIRKGDRLLLRIWYFEVTDFFPYNTNFSEIRTLDERERQTEDIAAALSFYLDVPDNEQPPIIAKIFKVIDQEAVPNLLIDVVIHDVTLRSFKLLILGLKQVRLDSLPSTEQKMSCAICLENFSGISDSLDDRHDQKLILRLPCSHLYHRHCMARWLLTSHRDRPVCQDGVPIVGAGRERPKRLQFSVGQYPTPIAPVSEPEPPSKPLWLQMVDKPHLGRPDKVKLHGCRCYVNC